MYWIFNDFRDEIKGIGKMLWNANGCFTTYTSPPSLTEPLLKEKPLNPKAKKQEKLFGIGKSNP